MANNRYITGDIANIPAAKKGMVAPLVQAVEPIKGDWAQNNNWAFSLDAKLGWPLVNNPTIRSVGQNQVFRGPPRCRGLLLTRQDTIYAPGVTQVQILARITYGAGGVSNQLFLDWGSGIVANIVASTITVEAIINGSNDNAGSPAMGSVLGVFFSNELIPKTVPTTFTETVDLSTTGGNVIVPANAVGFSIAVATGVVPATAEDISVYTYGSGSNTLAAFYDVFSAANSGTVYTLPSKASGLSIGPLSNYIVNINWVLSV